MIVVFVILSVLTYNNTLFYLEGPYRLTDIITITLFLISAILCFSASTIMHIFHPCSEKHCHRLMSCDYCSILFLIINSYNVFIYYSFYCIDKIQYIYYIIINTLGLISFISLFLFNFKKHKKFYIVLFVSLICSIFIPIAHKLISYNSIDHGIFKNQLIDYGYVLMIYLIGFLFYITKLPERLLGQYIFNYITSHGIFHIFIGLATVYNYFILLNIHSELISVNCTQAYNGSEYSFLNNYSY